MSGGHWGASGGWIDHGLSRFLPANLVSMDESGSRMDSLLRAAQEGGEEAFDQIVTELTPTLWHVARASGLNRPDAEDVVQTAWLSLVSHLDTIRTPAALKSWLLTTTKREAWRVKAVDRRTRPADDEWLTAIPDPGTAAEEYVIIKDEQRALLAAFAALPQRCQELLRMVAFEARPDYDVIAASVGMPRGSVGPTRGRCLDKLRVALNGKGDR